MDNIGSIVLICAGLVFIFVGFVMMLIFQMGNRSGQDVEATIMDNRVQGMGKTARHFATLRYQINGHTYTSEICTDTISARENGATLTIGIDPRNPEKVYLRRGRAYIVFYVMGGALVALALFIMLGNRL